MSITVVQYTVYLLISCPQATCAESLVDSTTIYVSWMVSRNLNTDPLSLFIIEYLLWILWIKNIAWNKKINRIRNVIYWIVFLSLSLFVYNKISTHYFICLNNIQIYLHFNAPLKIADELKH